MYLGLTAEQSEQPVCNGSTLTKGSMFLGLTAEQSEQVCM